MALCLLVTGVAGCGGEPAAHRGQLLFADPTLSPIASNAFACATCHSVEAAGDPRRILPGYALHDAATRAGWWGGGENTLFDAVNECYSAFMRSRPLTADNADGRALLVYLESISPDATAAALPLTVVKDIVDVPNGDAARGATTYAQACGDCHGEIHTGKGRLSPNVSIIPDESLAAHGTDPKTGARPVTIEKVRHGRFFSVGGNMPLFAREALSDAQLGDILSYLGL